MANYFVEDCLVGLGLAPARTHCPLADFNTTLLISTLETFISQELNVTLTRVASQVAIPTDQLILELQSCLRNMEETVTRLSKANDIARDTVNNVHHVDRYNFAMHAKLDLITTSPRPPFLLRLRNWIPLGSAMYRPGEDPRVLFLQENSPREVWRVAGSEAQVGFVLSRPIVLSSLDISLLANNTSGHGALLRCNPYSFTLWGLIDGHDNLKTWNQDTVESKRLADRTQNHHPLINPALTPGVHYIPLAHLSVDPTSTRSRPTRRLAEVFPEVKSLGMDFAVFILRVEGIPGIDEVCLHRIGLYGTDSSLHTPLAA